MKYVPPDQDGPAYVSPEDEDEDPAPDKADETAAETWILEDIEDKNPFSSIFQFEEGNKLAE